MLTKQQVLYVLVFSFNRLTDVIVRYSLILFFTIESTSSFSLALILLFNLVPFILLAPYSGVLVDKVKNKKIIISFLGLKVAGIFSLVFAKDVVVIYILSFLISSTSVFLFPALKKWIRNLATEQEFIKVNSISTSAKSAAEIVGPALAGVMIAFANVKFSISICVGITILTLILVLFLKSTHHIKKTQEKVQISIGFSYILKNKSIFNLLVFSTLVMFFSSSINIIFPLLYLEGLEFSTSVYGILMGVLGLGSLLGGAFLYKLKSNKIKKLIHLLCLFMLFDGLAFILLSFNENFFLFVLIMLMLGITSSAYFILIETLIMLLSNQHIIGRVFASYNMLVNVFSFISIFFFGILLDLINLEYILVIAGLGILISVLVLIIFERNGEESVDVENINNSSW